MAIVPGKMIVSPNMGLYLDRPAIDIPDRAIKNGLNFRVKSGTLQTTNLGWSKFTTAWTLDDNPVLMIDNFFPRELDEKLIFGTHRDLYLYDADTDSITYLNATYITGTIEAAGTAITGTGTAWSTNVEAGDFISFGLTTKNSPDDTWREITEVGSDTTLTLATSAGVIAAGTAYTIRKVFHMAGNDRWDYDTFVQDGTSGDDLWMATNNVDPVVSWNGSDATVTWHDEFNFTCGCLCAWSNMMIYGDITSGGVPYPSSIINSDVGFPLAAGDVGTGLSEQFRIHDGTDPVINLAPLSDNLVIYSSRHVTTAQFVGDPFVFSFRNMTSGFGPVASGGIADFGDFHEFVGADSQYSFDGVTLSEVNSHVMRDILRTADPIRRGKIYGHFDEEQGDLIWSIPFTTDDGVGDPAAPPELAYTEHYLEDAGQDAPTPFSRRQFPFTATGFWQQNEGKTWEDLDVAWSTVNYSWNDQFLQAAYPINLAGDENGQIYILNTGQTGDGAVMNNWVWFGRKALGDTRTRSLLTRVYPFIRIGSGRTVIRAYMSDHAAGENTPAPNIFYELTQPENGHRIAIYRRGRFMELFVGSSEGTGWIMEGYTYDYSIGGTR